MSDDQNDPNALQPEQPRRPSDKRGPRHYAVLGEPNVAASAKPEPAFTLITTATLKEGGMMDNESRFVIEMVFKPNTPGLKLRPEETQLLLSYCSEILREIEEEAKN